MKERKWYQFRSVFWNGGWVALQGSQDFTKFHVHVSVGVNYDEDFSIQLGVAFWCICIFIGHGK